MRDVFNFSAGPAMIPEAVLKRAQEELPDYRGTGMSVMEMSHRSKAYDAIIQKVEADFRSVMNVPETHKVLFLQGGATLQFSAVPMNLLGRSGKADYALTGEFSSKAYKEAKKFGDISTAADLSSEGFCRIPAQNELKLNPDADYFHYCLNNTIYGTTWKYIPETGSVPLVTDASSCILSEPADVSKYGLIYAGAQKNMGPAGLAVVILREDILAPLPGVPTYMDYATQIKNASMLNTPPTYGIYLLGLVLDWIREMGGLTAMKAHNEKKAQIVYDALDSSSLFKSKVEKESRSMMNVVFSTGDGELDDRFVKEAASEGLVTLKGHRAVGGMRASIYNAMPVEGCRKLADFMREFEKRA